MGRLVRDDRKTTVTQITTRYNQGMQNTISERTLEMDVCENPSRSAVSEILRPARLAPTTIPRSMSLKSPFFPVLMLSLNFSKSSSSHLDD